MCMFRVNGVKTVWLTTIIGFGFVIGFVLANTPGKFSRWNFAISTKEVFTRFDTVMCLVYNIVCSLLVGYLINVVIRPRWYPTLYEQYAVKNYEG
jgi:phospholipid-translocating ATPase